MTGFKLRSGDAGALATLMYSLGDLTKTLALRFDANGIEAQEKVCQDCVLLSIRLPADKLRVYSAVGCGGILLRPDDLYIVLSQAGQRDEVEIEYDDAKEALLHVRICREEDKDLRQEYELKLLKYSPRDVFESPKLEMDYVLAISTAYMTNTFSRLLSFGTSELIYFNCDREKLTLSARGDHIISMAAFTVFTGPCSDERAMQRTRKRGEAKEGTFGLDTEFTRSIKQESVEYRVLARHIRSLIKAFGINRGSTFVYLRKDYPLVFELHVGALGTLSLTVLPIME